MVTGICTSRQWDTTETVLSFRLLSDDTETKTLSEMDYITFYVLCYFTWYDGKVGWTCRHFATVGFINVRLTFSSPVSSHTHFLFFLSVWLFVCNRETRLVWEKAAGSTSRLRKKSGELEILHQNRQYNSCCSDWHCVLDPPFSIGSARPQQRGDNAVHSLNFW